MPDRKTKKVRAQPARKTGRSSPAIGSYFLSLELENVRCFSERQTLDLSDGNGRPARWTILLGENGTGKTTILQLLSAVEPLGRELASGLLEEKERFFLMPRAFVRRAGVVAIADVRYAEAAGLMAEDIRSHGVTQLSESDSTYGLMNTEGRRVRIPVSFGYGAGRRSSASSLDQSGAEDASASLFLDEVELINAEGWLLQLDYSASKSSTLRARQRRRLELVKEVLINLLPGVTEIRFDPSSGVRPIPKVEFKTQYGWVPIKQLGYGYRTMIAWIVDLAARMIERYPGSRDPLAEPAVVLVDEIDLHLHPRWQREVIGYLTERFPNTQFIVTAHSPLIVQAAAGANIAVLKREGDHVVIDNHPETIRGWRVDQVLTSDLFGLETARPPEEEKLLLRRKEILAKSRLTKADRKTLEEINDQLGPIPSGESFDEAKKTMELIERSLKLIEKYQGTKS
jgi:hypothetical protein